MQLLPDQASEPGVLGAKEKVSHRHSALLTTAQTSQETRNRHPHHQKRGPQTEPEFTLNDRRAFETGVYMRPAPRLQHNMMRKSRKANPRSRVSDLPQTWPVFTGTSSCPPETWHLPARRGQRTGRRAPNRAIRERGSRKHETGARLEDISLPCVPE